MATTKSFKIEIKGCEELKFYEFKKVIEILQYQSCLALNKAIREFYIWENKSIDNFKENERYFTKEDEIKEYGKSFWTYVEDLMKEKLNISNTGNVAATLNNYKSKWQKDKLELLITCEKRLSNFKNDTPYIIHGENYNIIKDEKSGDYKITVSFFNKKFQENIQQMIMQTEEKILKSKKENKSYAEYELRLLNSIKEKIGDNKRLTLIVGKIGNNEKSNIEKIMNYNQLSEKYKKEKAKIKSQKSKAKKENDKTTVEELDEVFSKVNEELNLVLTTPNTYKQGTSQLTIKDKKIFMNISFSYINQKQKSLDKNRIMGVDLGIANVATMQIWDKNKETWDRLSYKECMIDGGELIHFRQKTEARKRSLLRSRKVSNNTNQYSKGKKGHGTQTRIKVVKHLRNKIANFQETMNHKYSKYIVDMAIKHNCGVIVMEDLKDFSKKAKESFLKNWTYHQLQTFAEYKAEDAGIETYKIKPNYTSKRCVNCGGIYEENRDCKNNQAKFECVKCGHKEHADIVGAKNICYPDIENEIKEQLEVQKKYEEKIQEYKAG